VHRRGLVPPAPDRGLAPSRRPATGGRGDPRAPVSTVGAAARALLPAVVLILPLSCAYPRRTTSLAPATDTGTSAISYPEHVWRLEFVETVVPPRQRSGLPWDDDEAEETGGPDPYVRILRNGKLLFASEPLENTFQAEFEVEVPGNLRLPPTAQLQVEVWDADRGIVSNDDPIGVWRNRGLPANAVPDGDLRLRLDSGVTLIVRVRHPKPYRGIGVTTYEVRDESFRIVEIVEDSPVGRAGIEEGDTVVAIDGESITSLGDARAATAFSLAAERGFTLTVERDGVAEDVLLDDGYVWPVR